MNKIKTTMFKTNVFSFKIMLFNSADFFQNQNRILVFMNINDKSGFSLSRVLPVHSESTPMWTE